MGFGETLVFYLVLGCVVAVAVYVTQDRRGIAGTAFRLAMAAAFWPLYLPLLLSSERGEASRRQPVQSPDGMAAAIADVERELDAALANLDGWAESALAREKGRIAELREALSAQARRIREMDALLAAVAPADKTADDAESAAGASAAELPAGDATALGRCRRSEQARAENLARLATVRRQTHADLMATLAWIRELVSMMHLAKFTGAPASRSEELMAQIAAAVEGISAAGRTASDDWPAVETTDSAEPAATDAATEHAAAH
ncbi:MAG TPA: hypothetical protein VMF30_06280 [Pirellulales bacterium]|nr:hypothetical protein [Pirellulales bacterium]